MLPVVLPCGAVHRQQTPTYVYAITLVNVVVVVVVVVVANNVFFSISFSCFMFLYL